MMKAVEVDQRLQRGVEDEHSKWLLPMVDSLLLTLEWSKPQEEREAKVIVLEMRK
jgi:hypothetical protein